MSSASNPPGRPVADGEEYLREHTVCEPAPFSAVITIVDYDPQWPEAFKREEGKIRSILGNRALRVEHTGSTAVPGLAAKPVIDILLVVANAADENRYAPELERSAYRLVIREPEWHQHRMFKGADPDVNLHIFSAGCDEIDRVLTFRNWLRVSEIDRELYARTKRELAQRHWKYTQDYADAKTSIIEIVMARASSNRRSEL